MDIWSSLKEISQKTENSNSPVYGSVSEVKGVRVQSGRVVAEYGLARRIRVSEGTSEWVTVVYGVRCSVCQNFFRFEGKHLRVPGHTWCTDCKETFDRLEL